MFREKNNEKRITFLKESITLVLQLGLGISTVGYLLFGMPGLISGAVVGVGGAVSKQYHGAC